MKLVYLLSSLVCFQGVRGCKIYRLSPLNELSWFHNQFSIAGFVMKLFVVPFCLFVFAVPAWAQSAIDRNLAQQIALSALKV